MEEVAQGLEGIEAAPLQNFCQLDRDVEFPCRLAGKRPALLCRLCVRVGVHAKKMTKKRGNRSFFPVPAKKFGHLDILVNNAGIMIDESGKKISEQSPRTWRDTFDTNVFGLIDTTNAFLPLLHKSASGRIVNVSSLLGSLALHSDPASPIYDFKVPAYNVSKSAVNAWTVQLAYELKDSKVKVNTIHPGYVKTDMNAGAGEIDVPDGARTSIKLALIDDNGPNGSYFYLDDVLPW